MSLQDSRLLRPFSTVRRALRHVFEELPGLRASVTSLRDSVVGLSDTIAGIGDALGAVRESQSRSDCEIAALRQDAAALRAAMDSLEARLGTMRDQIPGDLLRMLAGSGRFAPALSGRPAVPAAPSPDDPRYSGLAELDRKLAHYLRHRGGFFVELGANDGISQSNTLYFERYRDWRGVLIEPVPHNFLLCLENRSPETRVFCCACTSFEYRERFVEIAYSNLMSTPIGLESDIADPVAHAEDGLRFLPTSDRMFRFGAVARPLNDLLVEAAAPGVVDLLSLDVEGAEIEVLKGVDHARFRFRFICVECRDIDRLTAYLTGRRYALVERLSHHDYLFRCTITNPEEAMVAEVRDPAGAAAPRV